MKQTYVTNAKGIIRSLKNPFKNRMGYLDFSSIRLPPLEVEKLNRRMPALARISKRLGKDMPKFSFDASEADGIDLSDTNLTGSTFFGAKLYGANFKNANLSHTKFGNYQCSGADPWTPQHQAELRGINLEGANLDNALLLSVDLSGVNARKASFKKAAIKKVNFKGANLRNADFTGASFDESTISEAKLKKAILKNTGTYRLQAENTELIGADLRESRLKGYFGGVNLRDADMSEANLYNSNFENARMLRANLSGAQAYDAHFLNAKLNDANLTGAVLGKEDKNPYKKHGTNLRKADITGVKGLEQAVGLEHVRLGKTIAAPKDKETILEAKGYNHMFV